MQFRLTTLLYVFAIVAAGLAAFGWLGIVLSGGVLLSWWAAFADDADAQPIRRVANGMGVFLVLGALILFLLPAISSARYAARRNMCLNHGKQIALAFHNYASVHRAFPPPYSSDAAGQPLHSWRVLLLPYLETGGTWWKEIRMDEPWNSPHNLQLANRIPEVYRCPGCDECNAHRANPFPQLSHNSTNYFAVTGAGTIWQPGGKLSFNNVTDGTADTIMFLELSDREVNWMEPTDVSIDEAAVLLASPDSLRHVGLREDYLFTSFLHGEGAAMYVDGHAATVGNVDDTSTARGLFTYAGREPSLDIGRGHALQSVRRLNWRNLYSLLAFVALSFLPAVQLFRKRASAGEPTETSA